MDKKRFRSPPWTRKILLASLDDTQGRYFEHIQEIFAS